MVSALCYAAVWHKVGKIRLEPSVVKRGKAQETGLVDGIGVLLGAKFRVSLCVVLSGHCAMFFVGSGSTPHVLHALYLRFGWSIHACHSRCVRRYVVSLEQCYHCNYTTPVYGAGYRSFEVVFLC